jgi:general stress protein 26
MGTEGKSAQIHELVASFRTAMLITRSEGGEMRARPMTVAEVQGTADLFFAANMASGCAHEITDDAHVCVTLQDDKRYLSLTGVARIEHDGRKIDELWRETWRVWFPEGKNDPNLCLIRVNVRRAEFWDQSGTKGPLSLLESLKAYVTRTTPSPVEGVHGVIQKS